MDDALVKAPAASRGITFDEALAARDAATTVTVDSPERIQAAEALAKKYPDPRSVDPTTGLTGDTSVGIDQFVHTNAPPILPPENSSFTAQLKSDFVSDPETKRKLIAKTLFPNDPNGHQRVGVVDGIPVYVDDKGQLRKVADGWERFGASAVANSPEAIMGGVGSLATSVVPGLGPVAGGAMGAAGAHGIKRGIAGLLTDEPQTWQGNLGEMAGEAAVNTAAGLVGKGIASIAGRGKIVDFTPSDVKSAVQARDYIKNSTGIDVDLAQASGNNKLIGLRAYAARYPGKSAELVQAAEEAQKGQLESAVNKVLNQVATTAPSEVAGMKGINAASAVIELAKGARDKAVDPFYRAAEKVRISRDVAETLNKDPLLRHYGLKVQKDPVYQRQLGIDPDAKTTVLTNTTSEQKLTDDRLMNQQRMEPTAGPRKQKSLQIPAQQPVDTVGYWHQVQQAIDDDIAKNANEPNRVRILTQARKDLNKKLEAASPEFAQANAHYAEQTSKIVEPLENSAVGALARVTNPRAATVAAKIFNDPNISAAEIRATRTSIEKQDPEAWNGLVRQWMSQAWNKGLKVTQTGESVNPAGKLRQALVGTPEQRARAAAMMPTGSLQAFEDLMNASKALSRTPTAGSNTARDLNIEDQLKGQGGVIVKWLTSPRASAQRSLEGKALEKNTLTLTEALLDPAKQKQLRVIVKMSDNAKKAAALASLLGGQVTERVVESDTDHRPDAQQQ